MFMPAMLMFRNYIDRLGTLGRPKEDLVNRRHTLTMALIAFLLAAPTGLAWAIGTPAGSQITNQASATFTVGAGNFTVQSNITTTLVAEILDLQVTWQDASDVPSAPGSSGNVLTFSLSNTGNGQDSYSLAVDDGLTGDDFDPIFADIYLDSNGNGSFDPGVDTLYVPGVNDPDLISDASLAIFVMSDIPGGTAEGAIGASRLEVQSGTGIGSPGDVLAGAGEGGADAMIGNAGGQGEADGRYVVLTLTLNIVKGATISDPFGGTEPVPGALISYTLSVTIIGSGTAQSVVITDPIPGHTSYDLGSLTLNGTPLSDGADADAGDVGGSQAGSVTVNLGDIISGAPSQVIAFNVTIN